MSVFDIEDFDKVLATAERVQTVYFGFDDESDHRPLISRYQEWEIQEGKRRKPLDVCIGDIVEVCMSVADGPFYYSVVVQLGDVNADNPSFIAQKWYDTIEEAIAEQRRIHGF